MQGFGWADGQGRLSRIVRWTAPVCRGWVVVLCLLSALAGSLLAFESPAMAASNGDFSVAPSSTATFQRTYFTPLLRPGVQTRDSAVVVNQTDKPLKLYLYAADAYTTKSGGFAVQPNYKPKMAMGAWIHLPASEVTIPPLSGSIIPFTYNPPANVKPGVYAGAVVAEQTKGALTGKGTIKVQSLQAVAAAVYGRVNGPARPRLTVSEISIRRTSPWFSQFGGAVSATVTYSITNTGNEYSKPVVTVSLSPLIGSASKVRVHLPPVLPGSTITFSHTFKDVVPFGHLTASVTATTKGATASGSAGAIVVPWGLVVIVLLAAGLIYWRVRRRRRPTEPEDDVPGTEGPSGTEGSTATVGHSGGSGAPTADPVEAGPVGGGP